MKKVALALCVTVLMAGPAFGQVIFEHVGDTDPEDEGFFTDFEGSYTVGPVDDDGVKAWRISDEGEDDQAAYQWSLTGDDLTGMFEEGWTLTGRLRVTSGPNAPVNNTVMFQVRANGRWWRLDFGTDEENNPLIGIFIPGSDVYTDILDVTPGDGYHTYQIVNEGNPDVSKVLVDGTTVYEDWTGGVTGRTTGAFGSNNSGVVGLGSANYALVRLEIGVVTGDCSPGDADGDGDVDDDDLSLLLAHWGQDVPCTKGEFSGQPPVDDDDLSLLLANWTGAVSTVPEPASIALIAVGSLALLRRKR